LCATRWWPPAARPRATGPTPWPCARPADADLTGPPGLARTRRTIPSEDQRRIPMVSPKLATAIAVVLSVALAPAARADINIGVTLSATGPAASLGIPEKNTFELLPTSIAGQKVNRIVVDAAPGTTKQ